MLQIFLSAMEQDTQEIYVLDACVFLSPRNREYLNEPCMTTYHVVNELKSMAAQITLDIFLKHGLVVTEPSRKSMQEVEMISKNNNEKISQADISILALAKELRGKGKNAIVVTDDYAVQNLCSILKIPYKGIEKEGIREELRWIKKCSVCGRRVKNDVCEHCGSKEFKFVPARK